MQWYVAVLKKYAIFEGRARRKEFWMFFLFNLIIFVVLAALTQAASIFLVPYIIYGVAVLIPSIAVTVRRLHDTGRSGFWYFISFIPLVGPIILLVFTVLEGDRGDNAYGPDPKVAQVLA